MSLLPLPVSSRVLNELGAWRPQVACLVACVALSLVFTKGIWASAVMILGHPFLGYCYPREEQVVKYVGEMLFLIAPSQLFDGIPSILSGFFFYHNISMKKTWFRIIKVSQLVLSELSFLYFWDIWYLNYSLSELVLSYFWDIWYQKILRYETIVAKHLATSRANMKLY